MNKKFSNNIFNVSKKTFELVQGGFELFFQKKSQID